MAKEIRYEFTVVGHGPFPIDMLRHDRCWPKAESNDSVNIHASFNPRSIREPGREVHLVGLNEPTDGRWRSFGWQVTDSRKVTLI